MSLLAKSANVDCDETPSRAVSAPPTTPDTIHDGTRMKRCAKHGIIVSSGSKVLYANAAAHEYMDVRTGRVSNPTVAMVINGLANGIRKRLVEQADETEQHPLETRRAIRMQDTRLFLRAFGIHNRSSAEEPRVVIILEPIEK